MILSSLYLLFYMSLLRNFDLVYSAYSDKWEKFDVNETSLCVFLRKGDPNVDDPNMPRVMVICSGILLSPFMALTVEGCKIQKDWFVYKVDPQLDSPGLTSLSFDNPLLNRVTYIYKYRDLSIAIFGDHALPPPFANIAINYLTHRDCFIVTHPPMNNKPIIVSFTEEMMRKTWQIEPQYSKIPVHLYSDADCKKSVRHLGKKFDLKLRHMNTTKIFCVDGMDHNTISICAFDRGAPLLCYNDDEQSEITIVGLMMGIHKIPDGHPRYVPPSCYNDMYTGIHIATSLQMEDKINFMVSHVKYRPFVLKSQTGRFTLSTIMWPILILSWYMSV